MEKILLINTGGTFNKRYNRLNGELEIDTNGTALDEIALKWLYSFETKHIIGKDSLFIDDTDRALLLATIKTSKQHKILIVHGTDTMEITAKYLERYSKDKSIVLTGAMVPFSIDPIEATANLSLAFGYLQAQEAYGIFIAMNGIVGQHEQVIKNREVGKFISHKLQ